MLLKNVLKKHFLILCFAIFWAVTCPYQDWRCAQAFDTLKQAMRTFQPSTQALPPYGSWEELTKTDFRLKIELLGFYQEIGAQERALAWAQQLFPEALQQPLTTQMLFFEKVLWLSGSSDIQAIALAQLRQQEPLNPAWLFHQHMIASSSHHPLVPPLSADEKQLLASYLQEIGEDALAQEL